MLTETLSQPCQSPSKELKAFSLTPNSPAGRASVLNLFSLLNIKCVCVSLSLSKGGLVSKQTIMEAFPLKRTVIWKQVFFSSAVLYDKNCSTSSSSRSTCSVQTCAFCSAWQKWGLMRLKSMPQMRQSQRAKVGQCVEVCTEGCDSPLSCAAVPFSLVHSTHTYHSHRPSLNSKANYPSTIQIYHRPLYHMKRKRSEWVNL